MTLLSFVILGLADKTAQVVYDLTLNTNNNHLYLKMLRDSDLIFSLSKIFPLYRFFTAKSRSALLAWLRLLIFDHLLQKLHHLLIQYALLLGGCELFDFLSSGKYNPNPGKPKLIHFLPEGETPTLSPASPNWTLNHFWSLKTGNRMVIWIFEPT